MSGPAAVRLLAGSAPDAVLLATVSSVDDDTGLGTVDLAGLGEVPFHCTAIADGTRTIPVGTAVACRLATAHLGGVEAVGLVAGSE